MKCDDARLLMNLAIDDEINHEDLSQLNAHLDHCEQCTVEYEELKYLKELMGEMEMKELPNDFEKELHVRLLEANFLNRRDKMPEQKTKMLGKLKDWVTGHGQYVVAAAAIALIVLISNNPIRLGGYKSAESMDGQAPLFAAGKMEENASAYGMDASAPQAAEMATETADERGIGGGALDDKTTSAPQEKPSASNRAINNDSYRTDRMIIKSGNINLEIVDYDGILDDIKQNVITWGGYIENESTSKSSYNARNPQDDLKYGSVIVRIPNDKFEEMMSLLKSYGNVIYDNVYAQDVTKEYRDTAQEVENLKLTETRFRELLLTATDMEDVLAIENELTRIRSQINQYERRLKDWEVLVDLSSISVELNEVKSLEPVFEPIDDSLFGKAKSELIKTINNIRKWLENIFIWVIANSPILVLIGIVAVIWRIRSNRKNKQMKS
ncbi:DUF4349 domain-containing protein [Fusibacter sp. 3D3]|uniref:DUF4349 domain-containing protein n=1 Tax=Fusibacter sp. 3D3 TaxID=1048380 RepID=UPI000852C638|nr:DUF4349 domain-containing protein [Fusibacter sp. 3D3]GAU77397.1 hypothetical protein F3D3_2025 [Fusibacter sp. 3D3]